MDEVARDELARRIHPLPRTSPPVEGRRLWQLVPGDLFLDTYAVADEVDEGLVGKGVDLPGRRKLRVLAHDTGRHRLVEHDHADIAVREARKPVPAANAEVRVGVGCSSGVALTGIAVKGWRVITGDRLRRVRLHRGLVIRVGQDRPLIEPDLDVGRRRLGAMPSREKDRRDKRDPLTRLKA